MDETTQSPKPICISVITVCFNDLNQLRHTIDSVREQVKADYEHIVIDGGSKDGTLQYLADLPGGDEFSWYSESDDGIFDAMNKGAMQSKGHVLVFINAGDTFTSTDDLAYVQTSFEQNKWDWAYGAVRYVNNERLAIDGIVQAPFQKRRLELGLRFVPHQAMYMTARLFKELNGFDLDFPLDSDQDMAMRAAALSKPHVMIRFLCDFLVGGAHENASRLEREMSYHRMRRKNGLLLGSSVLVDRTYSAMTAGQRNLRDVIRRTIRIR